MKLEINQSRARIERTYLLYHLVSSMFFVSAVWLYFYRLFMTDTQIGLLDGMAFVIGLVAEVPSGALADKFGRSTITRLGLVLAGSGLFIQAIGGGFLPIFVGQSILMIGIAFVSGADEALFYTKLNFDSGSTEWRKLVTKGSQMALVGTLVATLLGGWVHTMNPYAPWILTGIMFFISAALLWPFKDTRDVQEKLSLTHEMKAYFEGIVDGFKQFGSAELLRYVPLILTVQALFYAAGWGLLRLVLLDRFHFDPFWGAVVIAACSIVTIAILGVMHRYAERMNEGMTFGLVAVSAAIGLLIAVFDIGFWGAGVIFVLYAGEEILRPFLSDVLNKHANERHRATTLSVAAFFKVLPYVAMAPLIGALNDHNELNYFLIAWPILIGLALLFYMAQNSKNLDQSQKKPRG